MYDFVSCGTLTRTFCPGLFRNLLKTDNITGYKQYMNNPDDINDPIDIFSQDHIIQSQMCDKLEMIADSLPGNVDQKLCSEVIQALVIDMPRHHRDEEEGLFPLLQARAKKDDNVDAHLSHLILEHETDEGFSDELVECLMDMSAGKKIDNPDMCGYMMRGFFENYRRHIHWEDSVLLPLARKRLKKNDLDQLVSVLQKHRQA